ncbi:hypothetical protein KSS87_015298 [Heliosperma pusillum]|nr:hypothetical protein KSS87_015298 [Heliosperma pusillum]
MAGITSTKLSLSSSIHSSSLSFSSKPSISGLRHSVVLPRRTQFSKIYALTSNDIKVGINLEVDGAPWRIMEFLHVKPGKGAAFVRTKMRNYVTGNTVEKTFRAGSSVVEANISKETKQFTYKDGSLFVFMDNALNQVLFILQTTYEEYRLSEKDVGDKTKWLKEGMDCIMLFWNGKPIDLELPMIVKLKVVGTDPGLKGDTAQGFMCEARWLEWLTVALGAVVKGWCGDGGVIWVVRWHVVKEDGVLPLIALCRHRVVGWRYGWPESCRDIDYKLLNEMDELPSHLKYEKMVTGNGEHSLSSIHRTTSRLEPGGSIGDEGRKLSQGGRVFRVAVQLPLKVLDSGLRCRVFRRRKWNLVLGGGIVWL